MNCRVCDSTNLELAVDLGSQPWCNHFLKPEEIGKEPFYPLRLLYCQDCETVQLDYTVKKEIMFGNHTYLSGVTKSLSEHFKTVAQEVDTRFFEDLKSKCVLDIGSNDGTQLQHFKALGYDVLGVESSKTTAKIANDSGITTLNEFFNLELVQRLNRKFHIINAAGVFFHLEELHSVTEGIREALRDDGVFVVQFLYMKRIVENLAFDQIYHEHLLYYNLKNIEVLLNRHGLAMFDAYLSPIHGGSIVGFVTHKGKREISDRLQTLRQAETDERSNEFATYLEFGDRIKQMKLQNLSYLENAKKEGKKIFGFGAPVKGNTMLNYFGVGTQYLDCLVEKNELRRDLYSPGMHIPIVIEKEVCDLPDIYYVLAWNFKKEILANNQHLIDKGIEFYFPVNPKEV
ncbi:MULTISPECIES: class I SAM-dependent methyltransferase [Pseudanabaena]|uniref:C-methyltransferase n=2 Tax=Pseudanabaena TaxID=1152 RepID=L8MYH4_9CYAN|nr:MULTISPECIES: class I SAM-dependent methyltransferase [Pseudanabaena]ELS33062.1 C-methyltransferase [Pseudanabaena biceps PCC 7429]MDG3494712.1 class I SAM-dependent methyltransferase [Pseudanabaena catenata USMAC16]